MPLSLACTPSTIQWRGYAICKDPFELICSINCVTYFTNIIWLFLARCPELEAGNVFGCCLFLIHLSLYNIQMWHHLKRCYTIFKQSARAKVLQLSKTVGAWISKNFLHLTRQNLPLKRFRRTPNALLMQWTGEFFRQQKSHSAPVWMCAFWFMKQLTAAFSTIDCPHFSLG